MKQHIYNSMVGLMAAFLLMISLHAAGQKNELTFLQNSVENYTKNNSNKKVVELDHFFI